MVAAPRTSLQAVGEEESSKRRQILDGARKVFLELGFDGASMGEIARAAAWIHNDATKTRMPTGGFPSKHGY